MVEEMWGGLRTAPFPTNLIYGKGQKMKELTINGKDYKLEFSFDAAERKDFVSSLKGRKLSKNTLNLYRSDFEKLMKYYIFRYFLSLGYDCDVVTPVKYGVFACIVISRIYAYLGTPDFETRVKVMYSYSKEVEYEDKNGDKLTIPEGFRVINPYNSLEVKEIITKFS